MYTEAMDAPPIEVYYPYGGRRFLLNWWTYGDRGHLVIAPTEALLLQIARKVFADNWDAEIKALCEVDILAPSQKLCIEVAEQARSEELENFAREMAWDLKAALDARQTLPAGFGKCAQYNNPDDASDEEPGEYHYGCRNCVEGIRLGGFSREELYGRYFQRWREEVRPDRRSMPKDTRRPYPMRSRAPQATDADELHTAVADFGHHAAGIHLVDQAVISTSVLFYYLPVRDLDPTFYQSILRERKEAFKRAEKEREEQRRAAGQRRKFAEVRKTCDFFNRERTDFVNLLVRRLQDEQGGGEARLEEALKRFETPDVCGV